MKRKVVIGLLCIALILTGVFAFGQRVALKEAEERLNEAEGLAMSLALQYLPNDAWTVHTVGESMILTLSGSVSDTFVRSAIGVLPFATLAIPDDAVIQSVGLKTLSWEDLLEWYSNK